MFLCICKVSSDVDSAITRAQSYLEGKLASTNDNYAICIMAYALALSGSSMKSEAIAKLNSIAVKDGKLIACQYSW